MIFALYLITILNTQQHHKLIGIFGTQQECDAELAVQQSNFNSGTLQCNQDTIKLLDPKYRSSHEEF